MITIDDVERIDKVSFPARYSFRLRLKGLRISCLQSGPALLGVTAAPYRPRGARASRLILVLPNGERFGVALGATVDFPGERVSAVARFRNATVEQGKLLGDVRFLDEPDDLLVAHELRNAVCCSWKAGINFRAELAANDGAIISEGLRAPQIGALHAISAHWTLKRDTAAVVLPTGTGKTEVMIAASVQARGNRVLIVVPSDPLREQTAGKLRDYGLLRRLGVISAAKNPVVGVLGSVPTEEHFEPLSACNLVVTTMSAISHADEVEKARFASLFSEVFFDEAHHLPAETWRDFAKHCSTARVVLFTATPFREDGRPIPGKIIYNCPLSLAQELGLFRPIRFIQVFEPDIARADVRIADAAVEQLRKDLANGYDHILLARTRTISECERLLHEVYRPRYADLRPVAINSGTANRNTVLADIRAGAHRVVICVDMFGEGFDLPNLKVAAMHAVHRSIGITLQFIGRFSRTALGVGDASFVANTADDGVPEALEGLYQEDADWDALIADLSYDAIDPQARLSTLVNDLATLAAPLRGEISALTLRPKMSAEVFRAHQVNLDHYRAAFRRTQSVYQAHSNRRDRVLVVIVNQKDALEWTDSRDISVDAWDMYVAFHDEERDLLFVNSSRKGTGARLARAVSPDAVPIEQEQIFRAFYNIRRLILHSVGLVGTSRNVRFQMFAGLDVRTALDPVALHDKMKSNVTGVGYEGGRRVSVGCSRKGKIWSLRSGSLADWLHWCKEVSIKLSNPNAAPDDFLEHTLVPKEIRNGRLPDLHALMVDWPDEVFEGSEARVAVLAQGNRYGTWECEVVLCEWHADATAFTFAVRTPNLPDATFRLGMLAEPNAGYRYRVDALAGPELRIEAFGRESAANEFFQANPPLVRFSDGSQMAGEILLTPHTALPETYDRQSITSLPWADTNILQESRWKDGVLRPSSIQQRFIEYLERSAYSFIIDDDDSGECADVVAIEQAPEHLTINLWHCKYSSGDEAGNRIDDLYVVCGQAQKSIKWTWEFAALVRHLIHRESDCKRGRASRFVRGTLSDLVSLRKSSRRMHVTFRIGIVQPGLRAATIGNEHLTILGATSAFLRSITGSPLMVVAG